MSCQKGVKYVALGSSRFWLWGNSKDPENIHISGSYDPTNPERFCHPWILSKEEILSTTMLMLEIQFSRQIFCLSILLFLQLKDTIQKINTIE